VLLMQLQFKIVFYENKRVFFIKNFILFSKLQIYIQSHCILLNVHDILYLYMNLEIYIHLDMHHLSNNIFLPRIINKFVSYYTKKKGYLENSERNMTHLIIFKWFWKFYIGNANFLYNNKCACHMHCLSFLPISMSSPNPSQLFFTLL
jgi:hypothetical protein